MTSWSEHFPYLVPVWHSLTHKTLSNVSENVVDLNLDIEFGGIGIFNNTEHKSYKRINYDIPRPTLPFYIDSDRTYTNYAGINCLAFSSNRKILLNSKNNIINLFNLELNTKKFETEQFDTNYSHSFSSNKQSTINPFCYDVQNVHQFKSPEAHNILEIRLFENNSNLDVITQTRESLKIYQYQNETVSNHSILKEDISLNYKNNFFPKENYKLDFWDRNEDFSEDFMVSFLDTNSIYRLNIEEKQYFCETTIDLDLSQNVNKFIGLYFAKNLNPFLYYFGTHGEIFLGDTRQNMNGCKKSLLSIAKASQFIYYTDFELFQTFITNPMETHQIITSSDFNINFFDIRYPQKNLFQCKHMLTKNLVNKLQSSVIKTKTSSDKLLLLASNSQRCCLYTFDTKASVQPKSEHTPFYINLPKNTDSLFPMLEDSNHFIRGMQIIPGKMHTNENSKRSYDDFFSIALLLNSGDIFLQDFILSDKYDNSVCRANEVDVEKFKYENNFGNKSYFHSDVDDVTKTYLSEICEYINSINKRKIVDYQNNIYNYSVNCENCDLSSKRISKRLRSSKVNTAVNECLNKEFNFCMCLRNADQIGEELKLLESEQSDGDDQNELVSTSQSKVLNGKIEWMDGDPIDFDLIKNNWFTVGSSNKPGIRSLCKPLTVNLFDRWCKENKSDGSNVEEE